MNTFYYIIYKKCWNVNVTFEEMFLSKLSLKTPLSINADKDQVCLISDKFSYKGNCDLTKLS